MTSKCRTSRQRLEDKVWLISTLSSTTAGPRILDNFERRLPQCVSFSLLDWVNWNMERILQLNIHYIISQRKVKLDGAFRVSNDLLLQILTEILIGSTEVILPFLWQLFLKPIFNKWRKTKISSIAWLSNTSVSSHIWKLTGVFHMIWWQLRSCE